MAILATRFARSTAQPASARTRGSSCVIERTVAPMVCGRDSRDKARLVQNGRRIRTGRVLNPSSSRSAMRAAIAVLGRDVDLPLHTIVVDRSAAVALDDEVASDARDVDAPRAVASNVNRTGDV